MSSMRQHPVHYYVALLFLVPSLILLCQIAALERSKVIRFLFESEAAGTSVANDGKLEPPVNAVSQARHQRISSTPTRAPVPKRPLRVFILAGQSNMSGRGDMRHLLKLVDDNVRSSNGPHDEIVDALWNGSGWRVRDDVYIKYKDKYGKLTVGRDTGFSYTNCFGPEVMFGFEVGDAYPDEKVLLLKTSWGSTSLAVGFRPPSSGQGNFSSIIVEKYGKIYRNMILEIRDTLDNLETIVPGYDSAYGYEISGVVWFQGWDDSLRGDFVQEYESNLVCLIRDIRKDLDEQELPFVIGELGMHGLNPPDLAMRLRETQERVTLLNEFKNSTLLVRTAPFAVNNSTTYNGIYHYNGRADTYFYIGQAFGRGMLKLMRAKRNSETRYS